MGRIFALILILIMAPPLSAREIQARFDRPAIFEDETVTLVIQAETETTTAEPDLTPLQKNFRLLGTNTSTEVQIGGDRRAAKTQWSIHLEPKRRGTLHVPALTVGSSRTEPLSLRVKARTAGAVDKTAPPFFLEVEVEPKDPYVQAQVRYTARLFYRQRLLEGNLDTPAPRHALVEKLGEDISYQTTRHDRRYRVIERRYAIFPEQSGQLTIPTLGFQGRVPDTTHRSQLGGLFDRGRRIRLRSEPVTLTVRPRPADYDGEHWLPSAALNLEEAWPQDAPPVKIGEPVTRVLILDAKGLSASQLPELQLPDLPRARWYADKPVAKNRIEGGSLFGRKEQRLAIVPTAPGELALPEIRLRWWNTLLDKEEVAVLPARTLTVIPGAGSQSAPNVPSLGKSGSPSHVRVGNTTPTAGYWPWISGALLVTWVFTLSVWWRERRRERESRYIGAAESPTLTAARHNLHRACRNDDGPAAARAIVDWASARWPQQPARNLGAIADRLMDGAPLRELDRVLYSPDGNPWRGGAALWEAFKRGPIEPRPMRRKPSLPPLYPERLTPPDLW